MRTKSMTASGKRYLHRAIAPIALLLVVSTAAIGASSIEGEWKNRSGDFSIVVWVLGSVLCGHVDYSGGRDGRGNDSFFVGRYDKLPTIVEYESSYEKGRGTASLSLRGSVLKWHAQKEMPGDLMPADALLERVPPSRFAVNETTAESDRKQCEEWRPLIEGGKTDELMLQEIGGYTRSP
jgi:hypothetical protein